MYSKEIVISFEEIEKMRLSPEWANWQRVGETTNGDVFWNQITGEILFEDRDKYLIRRKL